MNNTLKVLMGKMTTFKNTVSNQRQARCPAAGGQADKLCYTDTME